MKKYIILGSLIIVLFAFPSCIKLWNKLYIYPEVIREEFYHSFNEQYKADFKIKTKGYFRMKVKGSIKSFIFFSNGLMHYNTSLDNNAKNSYRTIYCGTYSISGDTILVKYVGDTNINGGIIAFKKVFLIIDPNTLKLLCHMAIHTKPEVIDCFESTKGVKDAEEYSLAKFVPLDTLPEPYCWLMEKDWFYKNDQ